MYPIEVEPLELVDPLLLLNGVLLHLGRGLHESPEHGKIWERY